MAWYMGIDIGSGTSKGVILQDSQLKASHLLPSGVNYRSAAENLRKNLLCESGLSSDDISGVVATGIGANSIAFASKQAVDIRCCARGTNYLFPEVRTVIDIQGQTSQAIRLNENGQVINFAVNEKCASGSGRFLDIIANVLQVDLDDISEIAAKSQNPITFTTGCAVFGESEAVSRVAEGTPKEDILAGVLQALADKISALIDRIGLQERCAVSGGGALIPGLIQNIEAKLNTIVLVPPQPQIVNALGAALIATGLE